jgi:hypothetical protein
MDKDLCDLMQVLVSPDALAIKEFPKKAPVSSSIQNLETFQPMDSRDRFPPEGRRPVAFLYRRFWWTFWVKDSAPPPLPDANPRVGEPFDTVIIFPDFQGHIGSK